MKYIKEIANEPFKIGLYAWNSKFIVKVETPLYEQTYKVSEMDFLGNDGDMEALFGDEFFLKSIAERFMQMHHDFMSIMDKNDLI
jgi:hypothetical protein